MLDRLEEAGEHLHRPVLAAVARQPQGDQRVVVRPDRAVVVRHRVVAHLVGVEGADPPAGEGGLVEQGVGHPPGARPAGDPREQAVPRVRGPHLAPPLLAVERQGVGGDLLAPEVLLEFLAQLLGLPLQLLGVIVLAEQAGQRGGRLARGVDVPLHLAEGDRTLHEPAVAVEDGIERVLPPL